MKLRSTLVFFSLLVGTSAFAQVEGPFGRILDDEMIRIETADRISSTATDRSAAPGCKNRYRDLYSKKVIRISYAFGYADTLPGKTVLDYFSYNAFMARLTRPCKAGVNFCGFKADKSNPNLLRKVQMGPTGEQNYLVELRITKGSLSWDDEKNRSPENIERQMRHCQAMTDKFFGEVAAGADIVIYNGHSRNGGGPDFCPAIKNKQNKVNYPWYQANRPGITKLTQAMSAAKAKGTPNKIVGMFSCSSQLHFLNRFAAVNKDAGYFLTKRNATFHDVALESFAAVDGLLAQRCIEGFQETFGTRPDSTVMVNMFSKQL